MLLQDNFLEGKPHKVFFKILVAVFIQCNFEATTITSKIIELYQRCIEIILEILKQRCKIYVAKCVCMSE